MGKSKAIRAVAYFEAFKGIVVFVAATGFLSLIRADVPEVAAILVAHAHLDPASKYPQIFLDAASHLQDSRLLLLAAGAGAYSLLRAIEAYGLFLERTWAEVLAATSGAIYVPFELVDLIRRPTWHSLVILFLNVLVVAIMVSALVRRRYAAATRRDPSES